MEKTEYTILTGESYSVMATNEGEALAKFFVQQGYEEESEYEGEGYDFSTLDEDVEYSETLTEVI
jgi:hypothetical protein